MLLSGMLSPALLMLGFTTPLEEQLGVGAEHFVGTPLPSQSFRVKREQ